MNIVCSLVSIDRFEVGKMAHHWKRSRDAIGAKHVAGNAGYAERLAGIVALDERDCFWSERARIHELADAQRRLQPKRDFGLHIGKLFLHKLVGGERPAKLTTFERIGPRRVETGFGRA